MAGPLVVPPPPPGGPQPTQKTSEIIGTLRPTKANFYFCSKLFEILTLAQLFKLSKSETTVTSLDFDDTGEFLLAACSDDSLQLYNAKEGKHLKTLLSQKYGCHLARFTHHSQSILYASTKVDDTIRYLSTHDNQFLRYFKGHSAPVTALTLCPSNDTFLSCSLDNTVRLWDLSSSNATARLNLSTPYLAAYDPSATVIAIASASTASILLYDLRNYDKPPFATFDTLRLESLHRPPYPQNTHNGQNTISKDWTSLEFSNDGKSLLVGTTLPTGHLLLDAFSGDLVAYLSRTPHLSQPQPATPSTRASPGSPGPLGQGDVTFSADGRYVLGSSGKDHDALVWDTQATADKDTKVLGPMCGLPCKTRWSVGGWNPRFNMCASGDREVVFWVPDEHVGMKPP